jgi:hypothetical protein
MADIKEQAALSSIFASVGLAAGKFVAAFMTGSLGLLSDALHALLDVGATILTYFAIRISGKPADDKHHYGHGKIEAVAALIETGLLFVVAVYVGVVAIGRLRTGTSELEPSMVAYAILVISIVVDIVRSRSLLRIAKETKSEALAADALHFGSDLVSSAIVLLGLSPPSTAFLRATPWRPSAWRRSSASRATGSGGVPSTRLWMPVRPVLPTKSAILPTMYVALYLSTRCGCGRPAPPSSPTSKSASRARFRSNVWRRSAPPWRRP